MNIRTFLSLVIRRLVPWKVEKHGSVIILHESGIVSNRTVNDW